MHIVFVADTYYPQTSAIVEAMDLERAELEARGHDVRVLTPSLPGVHRADRSVIEVPSLPLPGQRRRNLVFPGLGYVDSVLKRADIVHVHEPLSLGLWAAATAKQAGVPVLTTRHPEYAANDRTPAAFAHSSAVVIPGRSFTAPLPDLTETPSYHVPSGIQVHKYQHGNSQYLHARLGLHSSTPLLLAVGRLEPDKNLRFLVGALRRLPEQPHLVIIGDGPDRRALESHVHQLGGGSHLHFLGPVPQLLMPDVYASGAVYTHTAHTDNRPRTLMEAAAAGLPTVAIASTLTEGIVRNRTTGLLTDSTETAFGRAIRQLLYRPALRHRMGAAAKDHARQHFDIRHSVDQLLDVYALVRRLDSVEA